MTSLATNQKYPQLRWSRHLRRYGVAVRLGSESGAAGGHHIRLSFAAAPNAMTTGIDPIRTALSHL